MPSDPHQGSLDLKGAPPLGPTRCAGTGALVRVGVPCEEAGLVPAPSVTNVHRTGASQ